MSDKETLVLVDGSALAFRSFYALFTSGMRNGEGTPTWAVFGFFKALFDLLEKVRPHMMAICFDLAEPTFRHQAYEKYKAHRQEMPDDLALQWPIIKEGVTTFEIPLYEKQGFEADDVIGTVTRKAVDKGYQVLILTGDQDAFQLIDESVQVLMPGKEGLLTYGRQEVFNKLGVWPSQIADYKGLCGDSSDNIPGVKGIGPKTASQLLSQFHTVESILQHLEEIKSISVRNKLAEGKTAAVESKDLATIRLDVPLDFDFEHCHLSLPKLEPVVHFLRRMEFNSILKRLPQALAPFNHGRSPELEEAWLQPVKRQRPAAAGAGLASLTAITPEPSQSGPRQLSIINCQDALKAPRIITTQADLNGVLDELKAVDVLSIDLETTGLCSLDCEIVGYALAWSPRATLDSTAHLAIADNGWEVKTAYIPVRHPEQEQLSPDLVAQKLKPFLENQKLGKIAQNAKFEMNVLSLLGIKLSPLVFDPMLASYVVNPDDSHGLKDQSERLLGHRMVRITELIGSGRKQLNMTQIPVSKAAPYALDDARVALELARYYLPRLDQQRKYLLWEMDIPATAVLARMEQTGVALDLGYLKEFSLELNRELTRLEGEIYEQANHPFNINSTQQLQKVLFDELKLPTPTRSKTKTGYSTNAQVLEGLKAEHPIVAKLLDYRQLSKLYSTYVDSLPHQISQRDGRLHGEFNLTGTSTGRLSSSNPNLQNIPIRTELGRRIRRAFVPGNRNHLILSADYSQIELRLLAHMSGDENLLDAFSKDQDIHARTAMEIFDVPMEKVTPEMRRVGKTINFSLIYQQGAYSTAQDLGISTREAHTFIEKYFKGYPRVRSFLTNTIEEARQTGYVKTLWGRRRYFRYLNDRNDAIRKAEERAAANAPLQGSAADLIKLAMIRLDRELGHRNLSSKLILQVHDELVLEVDLQELEETKKLIKDCMGLDQPLTVPLKVDVKAGPTWMDVK